MLENQTFGRDPDALGEVLLSIVVPVFNEADAVRAFLEGLNASLRASWPDGQTPPRIEIIFVDDGSTDGTSAVVRALRKGDERVKLVTLSRNFGKEAALSAGLDAASGDAAIPRDVKAVARLAATASLEMMFTMSSQLWPAAACSPAAMGGRYIKYYYM